MIKKFAITGLHYYQDFEIKFDSGIKVLVGENGIGKTTILSSLYYCLAREWHFLLRNAFEYISIELDAGLIEFSHADLEEEDIRGGLWEPSKRSETFRAIYAVLSSIDTGRLVYFPAFRTVIRDFRDALGLLDVTTAFQKAKESLKEVLATSEVQEEEKESRLAMFDRNLIDAPPQDYQSNVGTNAIESINRFAHFCNRYLNATYLAVGENNSLKITNKHNGDKVSTDFLSSGEKQIIHIFTKILLAGRDDLIVFLDEPEISLSIPWQKTILPDIVSSGVCSFVLAATHSPFIFSNEFEEDTTGIKSHIAIYGR